MSNDSETSHGLVSTNAKFAAVLDGLNTAACELDSTQPQYVWGDPTGPSLPESGAWNLILLCCSDNEAIFINRVSFMQNKVTMFTDRELEAILGDMDSRLALAANGLLREWAYTHHIPFWKVASVPEEFTLLLQTINDQNTKRSGSQISALYDLMLDLQNQLPPHLQSSKRTAFNLQLLKTVIPGVTKDITATAPFFPLQPYMQFVARLLTILASMSPTFSIHTETALHYAIRSRIAPILLSLRNLAVHTSSQHV